MKKNFKFGLILIFTLTILSSCKPSSTLTVSKPTVNSKETLQKPYLILISLDGFRWDYVEKYQPPHLSNFIKNGVKATSLIPSYPSKTFPNHYTIVTGLYPDNHGIIGNSFYSNQKDVIYNIRDREMVEDGSFYGGSPIWLEADKANMVSASFFFVGTEANIQGKHPTYYKTYDGKIKNEERVAQAIEWLNLTELERPHLITLYFSDMDNTGHRFGPNNDEKLKKALLDLDSNLGNLFKGVKATGLPVNIIIVSDHGMTDQSTTNLIPIESIKNDSLFLAIDNGSIANIHPEKGIDIASVFNYLKQKESHFKVYKTENSPGFEYTPQNKDWGEFQLIPDKGYYFSSKERIASLQKNGIKTTGVHGFDSDYKDMEGIFYASGPAFKVNHTIPSIKNIHIYPLMCALLKLDIPENIDGNLNEFKDALNTN